MLFRRFRAFEDEKCFYPSATTMGERGWFRVSLYYLHSTNKFLSPDLENPEVGMYVLSIPASAADAVGVNLDFIKTLVASVLSMFFIKVKPGCFSNNPRSLPGNPPDCIVLNSWVFNNFVLADELFAEALRRFETCLLVSND